MKNLKLYKKAITTLALSTIVLLSGCSGNKLEPKEENSECKHLTIYFEDKPVTFKECEGYDISTSIRVDGGNIGYTISKDGTEIFKTGSYTSNYNLYYINHSVGDEIIDYSSVQKTK